MRLGEVVGGDFTLRTYANAAHGNGRLRIYLDGDGTPWVRGRAIARDPTARNPLALHLIARDPHAAILLNRPCYNGGGPIALCSPELWTSARYGEVVVGSMVDALNRIVTERGATHVTLVGYSGGGVIARLVANRVARVDRVLTVAANLDHEAWTRWHGFLPLEASHNPASLAPSRNVAEVHLFGGADENVPRHLLARYEARFTEATFVEIAGFDHRCCWVDAWPRLLAQYDP